VSGACYWWEHRCPFVRLGSGHDEPTAAEWDALGSGLFGRRKLVYFIESTSGLIKIGVSGDPFQRLVELGPVAERVVALEAGGLERGAELHRQFSHLNLLAVPGAESRPEWWIHGREWFTPGRSLLDYLGPEPS
jgi:hypothetical protein